MGAHWAGPGGQDGCGGKLAAATGSPVFRERSKYGFQIPSIRQDLPGIHLNFGNRGLSTSIGVRGAHVTFGKTGTHTTVGLPGSGLSYTHLEKLHQAHKEGDSEAQPSPIADELPKGRAWRGWLWVALLAALVAVAIAPLAVT
jgi:hypothetical protein